MAEERISALVNQIRSRELILPEFQRGFVWNKNQVRDYLTSLYNKYPTGNILIWRTPNPEMVRHGTVDSDIRYFKLILDGQQRLTGIYTLMEGEPPHFYEGERLFFDIYFNVLSEEFVYYKPNLMDGNIEWISVSEFFQKSLGGFLKRGDNFTSEQQKFYFDSFDKLQKLENIKNYLYHTEVIEELDIRKVVDILCLVNSTGTRFSNSDLAIAHICSSWPEARGVFKGAQRKFSEIGFRFDLDLFMRCTSIIATNSAQYELLYSAEVQEMKNAWDKAERSLDYLFSILKSEAFISSEKTVGNYNVLVPIVYFLSQKKEISFRDEKEKNSFIHWFYSAIISGRFNRGSGTNLQEDIDAVRKKNPAEKLRGNLLRQIGQIRVEPNDLDKAGISSPYLSIMKALIVKNGAVDLFSGNRLDDIGVRDSGDLIVHSIFPPALLYKHRPGILSQEGRSIVSQLANFAFLNKKARIRSNKDEPLSYLRKIQNRFQDALKDQLIPEDEDLWKLKNFEKFLAQRRELIADAINKYMDDLLLPIDKTNLSIEDLIARGESVTVEFRKSLIWDYAKDQVSTDIEKYIARSVCAFMNSGGGTLIVGIDNGEVYGLDKDLAAIPGGNEGGLTHVFKSFMKNFIGKDNLPLINVNFSNASNKRVMIISVDPSFKPVFLEDGDETEFYVRSASHSVLLDVTQANDYIRTHWRGIEFSF